MPELDAELDQTVEMIWCTMFPSSLALTPGTPTNPADCVTGFVMIEGAFDGVVLLRCPARLAATLTDAMFDTSGDPSADDVRDAVGEITNMLAGNIKTVLPHPSHIGLPVVALGRDYHVRVVGAKVVGDVGYLVDGEAVRVTLVRQYRETSDE